MQATVSTAPSKNSIFFTAASRPETAVFASVERDKRIFTKKKMLPSTTPACEKRVQKSPQTFLNPEIRNNFTLAYAQSNAERI